MIPKSTQLTTSRLILRIPILEEIPKVFSATKYEGFNDGMLWDPPESEEPLIDYFHISMQAWEKGEAYSFSLITKNEEDFAGRIVIRREKEKGVWNIGFWTHPEHQGKGYMSEAVAAILKFGFEQLSAKRIEACHALWNKASEKVLKKNGLCFIRYIEKGFQKKGQWVEENLLGIKKEEWLYTGLLTVL